MSILSSAQSALDDEFGPLNYHGSAKGCLLILEKKADYKFNYKNALVEKSNIEISMDNGTVRKVLKQLLHQCQIDYQQLDHQTITLAKAKGIWVFGTVQNTKTTERIANVLLNVSGIDKPIVTDKMGIFRFYTVRKECQLNFYHYDYQSFKRIIDVKENQQLVVRLNPVEILSTFEMNTKDSLYLSLKSFESVSPSIKNIPTVGAEADALSGLKLLAGVQNVTFGQNGLSVRGGSPDQCYTLMDGIPVYNTFHFLGLFSIFNTSSINSLKLYKDAFPSKYSSRLSSVVDVSLNNGNKTKIEVDADIGIISSGIAINGPLIKNKLSFSVSARRTHADALTLPLQRYINRNQLQKNTTNLWAYDVFAKLHYQINSKNQLAVTAYNGGDQLNYNTSIKLKDENQTKEETSGSLGWRNQLIGAYWKSHISNKVQMGFEVSSSKYNLKFRDEYKINSNLLQNLNASQYFNGLQEVRAGSDATVYWNKNHIMQAGIGAVRYIFDPFQRQYFQTTENTNIDTTLTSRQLQSTEYFAYIENKSYFNGGNITYGLRYVQFLTEQKTYQRFQPKLLLIQNISPKSQLRFSLAVANQFVHLVPNNNLGIPMDIWLPVTNNIQPLGATQFSSKFVTHYKLCELGVSIFSKFYSNLIEHKTGSQLLTKTNWEDNLASGSGRVYGLELTTKAKFGSYTAFGAYTYNRSLRTVDGINEGSEYYSKYDRPHTINIVGQYTFKNNSRITASFSYASGNPTSLPVSRYITLINNEEVLVEEYGRVNNYRLPATHQLDVMYNVHRQHKKFKSTITFGIFNVYNRFNPFLLYIGLNENADPQLKLRSYLPIMPMFKYTIKI